MRDTFKVIGITFTSWEGGERRCLITILSVMVLWSFVLVNNLRPKAQYQSKGEKIMKKEFPFRTNHA